MRAMFVVLLPLLLGILVCPVQADIESDGVDDYVASAAAATTMYSNTDGTLMLWTNSTVGSGSTGSACRSNFRGLGDSTNAVWLALQANTLCAGIFATVENSIYSGAISTNTWYHLAVTWTGGVMRLYLDGIEVSSASGLVGMLNPTGTLQLAGVTGADDTWNGRLANPRTYSVPLSAAEIEVIAKSKSYRFVKTNPTGWWSLSECADGAAGNGVVYADHSGNGRTMTGNDGANNTGLTCRGFTNLRNPWRVQ